MKNIKHNKLALFTLVITFNLYAADNLITNSTQNKPLIGGISLEKNKELINQFPAPSGWLLSTSCSACHGTYGSEFNDVIPPIAGMDKDEFIKKMQGYKKRPVNDFVIMGIIVQPLSADEIELMAEFFSQQKAEEWTSSNWNKDINSPSFLKKEKTK